MRKQLGRAHWSLVDAYVPVVTYMPTAPIAGAYCNALLLALPMVMQFIKN